MASGLSVLRACNLVFGMGAHDAGAATCSLQGQWQPYGQATGLQGSFSMVCGVHCPSMTLQPGLAKPSGSCKACTASVTVSYLLHLSLSLRRKFVPASQGHTKKYVSVLETAPCDTAQSQHPALQRRMQARPQHQNSAAPARASELATCRLRPSTHPGKQCDSNSSQWPKRAAAPPGLPVVHGLRS